MHERGRPSGDAGNEYHDVVTVQRLADMVTTSAIVDVTPEANEPTDDIRTRFDDGTGVFEQVKERSPGVAWTAATLVSQGVISQFLRQRRAGHGARMRFVTSSDATPLIAACTRAASAAKNHESDINAAMAEWKVRLADGYSDFVSDLRRLLDRELIAASEPAASEDELFGLLGAVDVLDNQGRIDQVRERSRVAWTPLVADATAAIDKLERLARRHANERTAITRADVETTVTDAGTTPLFGAWAPYFDSTQYALSLEAAAAELDVAQLPALARSLTSSTVTLDALPARAHLLGGHGAGKTWLATHLALDRLREGRPALLVKLGAWPGSLDSLLLAELSAATGRAASAADLAWLLRRPSPLVIFDSIDEVPVGLRSDAESQVVAFARRNPDAQVIVTSRPTLRPWTYLAWPTFDLAPITAEQIGAVLGRGSWNLPQGLRGLSRSPLLLGLLRRGFTPGERGPETESEILDRAVTTLAQREAQRPRRPDALTTLVVLEELSFEWLSKGRVVVTREQLREIAVATVDRVAIRERMTFQASEIEQLVTDVGLAVPSGDLVRPAHRSLMDHLAGRAIATRPKEGLAGTLELREAVARYVANEAEASAAVLDTLDEAAGDLELLARCRHLARPSLSFLGDAPEFARRYHQTLRTLASTQLRAVGTLSGPLQIVIAQNAGWIDDQPLRPGTESDVVLLRNEDGGGGNISALRMGWSYGFSPAIRVPQLAAFDRVAAELNRQASAEDLPLEGAALTYERLCGYAQQFERVLHPLGRRLSDAGTSVLQATPEQLLMRLAAMVKSEGLDELRTALIAWVPQDRMLVAGLGTQPALQAPRDPKGQRSGLVVHGYALVELVLRARELGISNLPLHPLGILPESGGDPVLSMPDRLHDLHGDDLCLYVRRHEAQSAGALRQLVADNLEGIATLLPSFNRRPRVHRFWVEDESSAGRVDVHFQATWEPAEQDEWVVELGPPPVGPDRLRRSGNLFFALSGPKKSAYSDIASDVKALLGGANALGTEEL